MSSMSWTIFSTLPLLQTRTLCVLVLSRKSGKILNGKDCSSLSSCVSAQQYLPFPHLRDLVGRHVCDADSEGPVVVTVSQPQVGLAGLAHQARHRLLLLRPGVDQRTLGGVRQGLVVGGEALQDVDDDNCGGGGVVDNVVT